MKLDPLLRVITSLNILKQKQVRKSLETQSRSFTDCNSRNNSSNLPFLRLRELNECISIDTASLINVYRLTKLVHFETLAKRQERLRVSKYRQELILT